MSIPSPPRYDSWVLQRRANIFCSACVCVRMVCMNLCLLEPEDQCRIACIGLFTRTSCVRTNKTSFRLGGTNAERESARAREISLGERHWYKESVILKPLFQILVKVTMTCVCSYPQLSTDHRSLPIFWYQQSAPTGAKAATASSSCRGRARTRCNTQTHPPPASLLFSQVVVWRVLLLPITWFLSILGNTDFFFSPLFQKKNVFFHSS